MIVKYNHKTDLMYIYFTLNVPNIQVQTPHEHISKFVLKTNREHIIGYEIESAEQNLQYIKTKLGLSSTQVQEVINCFDQEKTKMRAK